MASTILKANAKFLVTGYNRSGKSSLINKVAGIDLAKVGGTLTPTQHEAPAMGLKHDLKVDGVTFPLMFIDTQGFGDTSTSDRKITAYIAGHVKKVDVILICHRLYQRVDGPIVAELKELARILGNGLMKHAIIVFTCGDEYVTNCRPKPVTELSNDEIVKQMKRQAEGIKQEMIKILKSNRISEETADNISYCITSADQDELPTNSSGKWVDEFWEICKSRCKPEAVPFVTSYMDLYVKPFLKDAKGWVIEHKTAIIITFGVAAGVVVAYIVVTNPYLAPHILELIQQSTTLPVTLQNVQVVAGGLSGSATAAAAIAASGIWEQKEVEKP